MQERKKWWIRAGVLALDLASLGCFGWMVIQGEVILDTVGSWTMVWALVLPGAVIFAAGMLAVVIQGRGGQWAEVFPQIPRSWNKWFTVGELAALLLLAVCAFHAASRTRFSPPWIYSMWIEWFVVTRMVRRGAGLWFHRRNEPF